MNRASKYSRGHTIIAPIIIEPLTVTMLGLVVVRYTVMDGYSHGEGLTNRRTDDDASVATIRVRRSILTKVKRPPAPLYQLNSQLASVTFS